MVLWQAIYQNGLKMSVSKKSTGLRVFAVHIGHPLSQQEWDKSILNLPIEDQIRIENYKNQLDKQRALLGTLLIRSSIQKWKNIKQGFRIMRDENGRPYLHDNYSWQGDFNLSHSGEWIIMAITETGKIGIDVEKIGFLNEEIVEYAFTHAERSEFAKVKEAEKTAHFYELWTKKEAMYKTGLFPDATPTSLDCIQTKSIYTKLFYIDPLHPVSLCWDQEEPSSKITIIKREELFLNME